MRSVMSVALAALCGCASSGTNVAGTSPLPMSQTVSVAGGASGSGGSITISPGGGPNVNTLAFPADQVWRAMPAAFDSLAIPVTRLDPATMVIGNEGFKIRQRLGKVPLSRYIDCGQTQIGPNADSYEVYITLVVQLVREGAGTRMVTSFESSARPLTFSQAYSGCTSRGSLESRLLAVVQALQK